MFRNTFLNRKFIAIPFNTNSRNFLRVYRDMSNWSNYPTLDALTKNGDNAIVCIWEALMKKTHRVLQLNNGEWDFLFECSVSKSLCKQVLNSCSTGIWGHRWKFLEISKRETGGSGGAGQLINCDLHTNLCYSHFCVSSWRSPMEEEVMRSNFDVRTPKLIILNGEL